ncbi:MAG: hypothetical protein ACLRXC_12680 [[Clostridium] leptum]
MICLIIAVPCWLLGKAVGGRRTGIRHSVGMIITLFWKRKDAADPASPIRPKGSAVRGDPAGIRAEPIGNRQGGRTSLPIIASTIATSLVIAFVLYKR